MEDVTPEVIRGPVHLARRDEETCECAQSKKIFTGFPSNCLSLLFRLPRAKVLAMRKVGNMKFWRGSMERHDTGQELVNM